MTVNEKFSLIAYSFCMFGLFVGGFLAGVSCHMDDGTRTFPFRENADSGCNGGGILLITGPVLMFLTFFAQCYTNSRIKKIVSQRDIEDKSKVKNLLAMLSHFAVPQEKNIDQTIIEIETKPEKQTISSQWNNKPKNFSSLMQAPGIGFHSSVDQIVPQISISIDEPGKSPRNS